ncbi:MULTISPECIES: RNA-binding domain-containing protein [unclassified Fusibacter]|uniref:RNA-binding domain-containing protein n=1 Tax=unclassified Fusibacter TaxID=2624464 RepID=UPI0013E90FAF|nr:MULTISPECIES: RNA-binding domain-containing protein [unclassified Fusibacter]MCK8061013.1 putative DNA binding domain-containing protein [Fusibacter sp. A2]NPE20533.1 transcriptional regulator [Fusibacter sp. A1]
MDNGKLVKLLSAHEGPKLDFKMCLSLTTEGHKKELTKDVIAIANSPGGRGHLIIGIEDKTKRIIGVDPADYPEEKIQQIVLNRCDPPITIRVETVPIDKVYVIAITVFKSHNKPHQMRQTGAFYIRRGSTTDFARRDEIASMMQHAGLFYNELIPVLNARIEHLDLDKVNAYLEQVANSRYEPGQEILLSDVGILVYEQEDNRFYPTIGGMLLFGKNPQQFLPHTSVKIIYHEGDRDRKQMIITGTIIELLDRTLHEVKRLMGDLDYPYDGIEEALTNALVHRDYFDWSRGIVVYLGLKNLEISNPGAIFDREPLNNIIRSATPKRRNTWLYHQLLLLDEGNRFTKYGLGLVKIKRTVAEFGGVKFANLRKNNLFKVILPGIARFTSKKNESEED